MPKLIRYVAQILSPPYCEMNFRFTSLFPPLSCKETLFAFPDLSVYYDCHIIANFGSGDVVVSVQLAEKVVASRE